MHASTTNAPDSLQRYIQIFDDALDASFCASMIQSFHALSRFHRSNGAGVRAGLEQSRWTELDIGPLTDEGFRNRIVAAMHQGWQRYVEQTKLSIEIPFTTKTSEWIIKRYEPGGSECFQPHFDSIGAVSNRYLVFLWYLNDVETGGETAFVDLGVQVKPKVGRLLMFPPYWMFQHEGRPPISGDKYIFSTYLLF
jgi:prolyl 4-hydroxylase